MMRALLIGITLAFLSALLFAPLAVVFTSALSHGWGAYLATFANSSPFVHPTSFSSFLACGGRCSWIDMR